MFLEHARVCCVITARAESVMNHMQLRGLETPSEEWLSKLEERTKYEIFEDFFENGAIALHIVGNDGTILYANKAELDLLGYEPSDYIGRSITEFHVDAGGIYDLLARLKRGERVEKFPARMRAKNSSIKCVEITSSAQFRRGHLVHAHCLIVDVSELHRVREEVRRKDGQLQQVLDALPAAVYMTDPAGKIIYYNRAAAELAGRTPEIGKDEWCVTYRLRMPDGTPLPHDQCPMAVALKENRPVRGVEAVAQRPDGTLVPFLPFPTPIHDERGTLIGAVNMLVDISERKDAEFNQRMLIAELNHRVKNNMAMLHGLLRTAEREATDAHAQALLADISQRVAAIAAAQQLFYRGQYPRSVSIREFVEAVCASTRQAFSKAIAIYIDADDGQLPNAVSTPVALILNELLTNAAKHGVNKRGVSEIAVLFKRCGGEFVLIVEDDGPGFELHETGRRSTGLGLVSGLARQLCGRFDVVRGSGARCIVRFPELTVFDPKPPLSRAQHLRGPRASQNLL